MRLLNYLFALTLLLSASLSALPSPVEIEDIRARPAMILSYYEKYKWVMETGRTEPSDLMFYYESIEEFIGIP